MLTLYDCKKKPIVASSCYICSHSYLYTFIALAISSYSDRS